MNFSFIIIILVFGGMMFFMSRTQKKQAQERQNTLNAMKKGDKVVTIGGLHGVLDSIDADTNTVDIDCEGVILTFDRGAIKSVVSAPVQNSFASTDEDETVTSVEDAAAQAKDQISPK
jgi:preprotein translocase subunit YajC